MAVTSCKGNLTRFRVKSRYKRLVSSTRYNKSPYTAHTVLSSSLRESVVKQVQHVVRKGIHQMCSVKYGASLLRNLSTEALTSFRWKPFVMELKVRASVLYALIKAAVTRPKMKPGLSSIGIAASVMLECRNKFLCQVQGIVSHLLYAGHCSKSIAPMVRMPRR